MTEQKQTELITELDQLLRSDDQKKFEAFVKEKIQPLMPNATYAKKIRPCWEFRGLEIAQPTKLEWLAQQEIGPYITKFSRYSSTDNLDLFPQLKSLDLSYSKISDLTPLSTLTHLEALDLYEAHAVQDVTPLQNLKKLKQLTLFRTHVKDITPLKGLTLLEGLSLCWVADVTDINPLQNLHNITELNISGTGVLDLNALTGLTKLKKLWARKTKIHDLSPLYTLTNLERAEFYDSPVGNEEVKNLKNHLPQVTVGFTDTTGEHPWPRLV